MSSMPRVCAHCGAVVPDGHFYCGRCGSHFDPDEVAGSQTLFYGAMQAPGRAKLILVAGEAIEGMSYHLNATHHQCGRMAGVIPFEDKFISENHTDFYYRENELFVRDPGSANGTYVTVRRPVEVEDGSLIKAGSHYFRVERLPNIDRELDDDGTVIYTSPSTEATFRVSTILMGGFRGQTRAAIDGVVTVGRDVGFLTFPDDGHLSRAHFKVEEIDGKLMLEDLASKNGTFIRITQPQRLSHGDYVFIGRQLLRVEIAV